MRHAFLAAALTVLCLNRFLGAATTWPATTQATSPAERLAWSAVDSERWIHEIDSFYVRFEGGWERSAVGVERRRQTLRRNFPASQVTEERFSDLRRSMPETLVIAFDRRRLMKRRDETGGRHELTAWDGDRAISLSQHANDDPQQAIFPSPKQIGQNLMLDLSWLRGADEHVFWWYPDQPTGGVRFDNAEGRVWRIVGRETFNGVDCHVIKRDYGWTRWYVGVERPLLHRLVSYASPRDEKNYLNVSRQIAAEFGNDQVRDDEDYNRWHATLPPDAQVLVSGALARERLKTAYPYVEHFLSDYKEVAPGRWFPMKQGYLLREADTGQQPIVTVQRHLDAVEIKINQPLDDALFKAELKEGVQTFDATHDPPLSYMYKKKFTPQEWQAIVDAAAKANRRTTATTTSRPAGARK